MTMKTIIGALARKIAPEPKLLTETSPKTMMMPSGALTFQRAEARPKGWTGRPFRWRSHDRSFAFHLDDGTPVLWYDCAKPEAYRGGFSDNFQTRVLVHPSPAIGWMILEILTLKEGGALGYDLGEYRLRRATSDECRPYFHDEDTDAEYRRIEAACKHLRKYYDQNGRLKKL